MSPTCEQCKDFLSENRVYNKSDYFKWSVTNHPNKFIQYGSDDARYKEATRKTSSMNNCYSRWYGDNPTCFRDNECAICLTEFENPSDAVTVCRNHHRFHRECIDNWMRGANTTCPTCRSPITYDQNSTPTPVIPSIFSRTPTPVIPSISSRTPTPVIPSISSRVPLPRAPPATSRVPSPIMLSSRIPPIRRRSQTRKSCKSGYKRNKSTGRCRKSCKSGSKRNKSTGRCRKVRSKKSCKSGYKRNKSTGRCRKVRSKKTKRSRFVDNAPMGECRSRKKRVCKNDPNCTYRSGVGCVKRKGAKKNPILDPIIPDIIF